MGNMETWLSDSHQVYCKTAASSAGTPTRHPNKNSNNRKNRKRAGNHGKREKAGTSLSSSLSSFHHAPRALFFFLPSLPTTQSGLCGGERQNNET